MFLPSLTMSSFMGGVLGWAAWTTDVIRAYAPFSIVLAIFVGIWMAALVARIVVQTIGTLRKNAVDLEQHVSRTDRDIGQIRAAVAGMRRLIRNFEQSEDKSTGRFLRMLRDSPEFDIVRPWLGDPFLRLLSGYYKATDNYGKDAKHIKTILERELDLAVKATASKNWPETAEIAAISHPAAKPGTQLPP